MMNFVRISVHTDPMNAELARSMLLDSGLHPLPIRLAPNVSLAGAEQGYWLWVPEPEGEKAKACLQGTSFEKNLWEGGD